MKRSDQQIIIDEILRCFPKLFNDFNGWQYGNGTSADKDFKRIYSKAKKLKNKAK